MEGQLRSLFVPDPSTICNSIPQKFRRVLAAFEPQSAPLILQASALLHESVAASSFHCPALIAAKANRDLQRSEQGNYSKEQRTKSKQQRT
jgi:hypothetical protein